MDVARYAPHIPLPDAAFVPGRAGSVRPASDGLHVVARTLPPDAWRENEAWLYGVDLWNHGFLWEAHEAWEQLWRAPFDAQQAEFLRGMIQCAAAGLKVAIGRPDNAERLASAGMNRVRSAGSSIASRYMGLEVEAFASAFRAWISAATTLVDTPIVIRLG
jgi:hypothetical protein